ncbi:MAG: Na+/H+ antiporter NhaA [Janthinobacterium lividum]
MPLIERLIVAPMLAFLRSESLGGLMLMLSAAVALIWANSPAGPGYDALLDWVPPGPMALSVHLWINDGIMVVFFLLVGLELRREITQGELASPARLAAPGIAAVGGMAVPALIFLAFNFRDPSAMQGWAVPVATDIAFALAVVSVLGARVPVALKVFLTALAIIDDLGAIAIIAVFYTKGLDYVALGLAAAVWLGLFGLGRMGVRSVWLYALGGVVLWALVFRSGVHATLAGVALAFVVPMSDPGDDRGDGRADDREDGRAGGTGSPAARMEHGLEPWVAYLVLPLFGLANAGLSFGALPDGSATDRLTLGIALGLVVGKQLGVFGALMAGIRCGLARRPEGITTLQLYGAAVLCGIGFTMSLFIGDIAFRGSPRGEEIKLAVFVASLFSAVLGLLVLWRAAPGETARDGFEDRPGRAQG